MRAMVLKRPGTPLVLEEVPKPKPGPGELLIKVGACGVCRTDLHIKEGDLPHPKLPLILGHEIVGRVEEIGPGVEGIAKGERMGVPWLWQSCGRCPFCLSGRENLCDHALYTGYLADGGFAEYTLCKACFAIPLPEGAPDSQIAPLLCAGLIGYRSYRKAAPSRRVGLYGFGAAAHLLAQLAVWEGKEVYAFTRPGDRATQAFARKCGALWAGGADEQPPLPLDAAVLFAPVGSLIPTALKALDKGGRCICGGIHMSSIPSFPYCVLWQERSIHSVANLTRADAKEYFPLAHEAGISAKTTLYTLEEADRALEELKSGQFQGAAVIQL